MGLLDASIVHIALPSMQHELSIPPATLQWVIIAYALGFGGFLLVSGKIGDRYGRRSTLISGLALFTLASAIGGLKSPDDQAITIPAITQGYQAAIVASLGFVAIGLLSVILFIPKSRKTETSKSIVPL